MTKEKSLGFAQVLDTKQAETLQVLRRLVGKWRGNGVIQFPTIPTLDYREELEFLANDVQPFVKYEQRTWKKSEAREYVPSHWETGFWRALSGREIELLNAQGGGRVEVSRGKLELTREGFVLNLNSVLVANDSRMDRTARQFTLHADTLEYTLLMSTTSVPTLTLHTHATLTKSET